MAIPKIIYYCWLSDDPVPEDYQKYVKLWKLKLPDYQFILWNTKLFDINKKSPPQSAKLESQFRLITSFRTVLSLQVLQN
jgi:mannosyltransferase OCH1-like enzyme